jgi:hypothetical protein
LFAGIIGRCIVVLLAVSQEPQKTETSPCSLSRRSQPSLALVIPLSPLMSRVGGGSVLVVRQHRMIRKIILTLGWMCAFFFGSSIVVALITVAGMFIQSTRGQNPDAIVHFLGPWLGLIGIASALIGFCLSVAGVLPGTRATRQKPPPIPPSR